MRQGTWDPLLQCCNACTWTNVSSSNKIQRNYKELKITACMPTQLGQIMDNEIQRDQKNPTASSEEPGAKAGRQEQKKGTVHSPSTQHHLRGGQTTVWAQPLDTPLPSPHIRNQLGPRSASERESKGTCYLFSLSPCCSRGPNKAWPKFLVWPLINFY